MNQEREVPPLSYPVQARGYTGAFVATSLVLAFLFVAVLYVLEQLNSSRKEVATAQASLREEIRGLKSENQNLQTTIADMRTAQRRETHELRAELQADTEKVERIADRALDRTTVMLSTLRKAQELQAQAWDRRLAHKANSNELGVLSGSMSAAQSELGSAEQSIEQLARDVGAAKAQLGMLAARQRKELQILHESSDRRYCDFTLSKNVPHAIPGIGVSLMLKKADPKGQRFNLNIVANDREMQRKGRSVFDPILFNLGSVRLPCELVVTGVGSDSVEGYLSVPSAAFQDASAVGQPQAGT